MPARHTSCLAALCCLCMPALAWASDTASLITPYEGSELVNRQSEAFNEYRRIVGPLKGQRGDVVSGVERLEGKLTRLHYRNPKGRSTLELARNYRQALEKAGLVVDYACDGRQACGHQRAPGWASVNGINLGVAGDVRYFTGVLSGPAGKTYVAVALNPQNTHVHLLEPAAMESDKVSVDASALAKALDANGKVELAGIFFESGRSELLPASNAALDQAALLMRQQPALSLDVVGHTDSQGSAPDNLALSRQRAQAVADALVARGIAADRLGVKGMGQEQPVADNGSEAGRARNRRVELVRR